MESLFVMSQGEYGDVSVCGIFVRDVIRVNMVTCLYMESLFVMSSG